MSGLVIMANGLPEFVSPDVYVLDLDAISQLTTDEDVAYAFAYALNQTESIAAREQIVLAAAPWAITPAEWAEAMELYRHLTEGG